MPLEWDFGKGDAALLLSQETRIVVSLMKVKATGEARLLIHAPPDVVVKLLDARQDGLMIKALLG